MISFNWLRYYLFFFAFIIVEASSLNASTMFSGIQQANDTAFVAEPLPYVFIGANGMAYPFQAIGINAGVTDGEIGVRMSVFAGERIGLEGGIFYTLYQKGNFEQQLTALFGYNRAITPSNDSTVSNKAIWIGPAYEVIYKIFHASIGGVLYTEPYQQASKASFQPMFRVGIQYWFDE
jgi:hypothetical protein